MPTKTAPTQQTARTVFEITTGERIEVIPPAYADDAAIQLSENSMKVLAKRYLRRSLDGEIMETPAGMFYRVAHHVAKAEAEHGGDVDAATETFYRLLSDLRFFPNSPTFTGAGTPLGQLAACFVLPIADDMGREQDGIFSTLRVAALIQQTGGGNGFSFSRLRPKKDVVHTSAGRATGPVGFLRVYDQAFGEIAQGGTRRGANMAVLRVDHPDIEDFIVCKAEEGTISNFNISVAITDEFMQAVKDDTDFALRNPRDGSVWRTVRARISSRRWSNTPITTASPARSSSTPPTAPILCPICTIWKRRIPVTGDPPMYTAVACAGAFDATPAQVVLDSARYRRPDHQRVTGLLYRDKPVDERPRKGSDEIHSIINGVRTSCRSWGESHTSRKGGFGPRATARLLWAGWHGTSIRSVQG